MRTERSSCSYGQCTKCECVQNSRIPTLWVLWSTLNLAINSCLGVPLIKSDSYKQIIPQILSMQMFSEQKIMQPKKTTQLKNMLMRNTTPLTWRISPSGLIYFNLTMFLMTIPQTSNSIMVGLEMTAVQGDRNTLKMPRNSLSHSQKITMKANPYVCQLLTCSLWILTTDLLTLWLWTQSSDTQKWGC